MYFFMMCLQVGNLAAPVEEWTVGGTALTSLMDVERRHGIVIFGNCYYCVFGSFPDHRHTI